MKKNDVVIGSHYLAKVSGKVVPVRITGESRFGGWEALNTQTHRQVRIKSAQRLRRRVVDAAADQKVLHRVAEAASKVLAVPVGVVPPKPEAAQEPTAAGEPNGGDPGPPKAPPRGEDRCATPRCKGAPVLTYEGRPLCQRCWERVASEPEKPTVGDAGTEIPARIPLATTPQDAGNNPKQEERDMKATKTKKERAPRRKAQRKDLPAPKPRQARGKMSGLDAAAKVLADAGEPLNCKTIVERALAKGYWKTGGKTPAATVYAAIIREIATKGKDARFRKTERGRFALAKGA
jgi:hypothetical protein